VPLRIALAAVCLAAAAWFALGYPGARDETRAKALLTTPVAKLSAAQRAEAFALLDGARRFRPDGMVDLRRASLLIQVGRRPEAAALVRRVLRREPRNVTAWSLLAYADPRAAATARRHQLALAPPVR
jgi:predicted Zn-dependent protease